MTQTLSDLLPRGVLAAPELKLLLAHNVITNAKESAINANSVDLHTAAVAYIESDTADHIVTLDKGEQYGPKLKRVEITEDSPLILKPGQFCLLSSVEVFNLPDYICAQFNLRSTAGRRGYDHLKAGWCDAGWQNSVLTLEVKNVLQHHDIAIKLGDRLGQLTFFRTSSAEDRSYSNIGNYNNDSTAQPGK